MQNSLISIIIATYNAELVLEATLKSIANQVYKNFELIIIDGLSTDKTAAVVKDYQDIITYYISESDKGIFDAWNKGLKMSKGDWISFMGAGDEYLPDALQEYINFINRQDVKLEYISSRVEIINEEGKSLEIKGSAWEWAKFKRYMNTPHVGSLHSRNLFLKYGNYNISYKIAGDYELLMRATDSLKAGYVDKITAKMLYGGVSMISVSFRNYQEDFRIKTETGKMPVLKARIDNFLSFVRAKIRYFLNQHGIYFHYNK